MSLSKKDYELIAKAFHDEIQCTPQGDTAGMQKLELFANRLAVEFQRDNHRFLGDKFIEACGFGRF